MNSSVVRLVEDTHRQLRNDPFKQSHQSIIEPSTHRIGSTNTTLNHSLQSNHYNRFEEVKSADHSINQSLNQSSQDEPTTISSSSSPLNQSHNNSFNHSHNHSINQSNHSLNQSNLPSCHANESMSSSLCSLSLLPHLNGLHSGFLAFQSTTSAALAAISQSIENEKSSRIQSINQSKRDEVAFRSRIDDSIHQLQEQGDLRSRRMERELSHVQRHVVNKLASFSHMDSAALTADLDRLRQSVISNKEAADAALHQMQTNHQAVLAQFSLKSQPTFRSDEQNDQSSFESDQLPHTPVDHHDPHLAQSINQLDDSIKHVNNQLSSLQDVVNELKSRLDGTESDQNNQSNTIKNFDHALQSINQTVNQSINQVSASVSHVSSNHADLLAKLESLESQMRTQRERDEQVISNLNQTLNQAMNRVSELETMVRTRDIEDELTTTAAAEAMSALEAKLLAQQQEWQMQMQMEQDRRLQEFMAFTKQTINQSVNQSINQSFSSMQQVVPLTAANLAENSKQQSLAPSRRSSMTPALSSHPMINSTSIPSSNRSSIPNSPAHQIRSASAQPSNRKQGYDVTKDDANDTFATAQEASSLKASMTHQSIDQSPLFDVADGEVLHFNVIAHFDGLPVPESGINRPIAALFVGDSPVDADAFVYTSQTEWLANTSSPAFEQPLQWSYDPVQPHRYIKVSIYDTHDEQVKDEDRLGSVVIDTHELLSSREEGPMTFGLAHEDPLKNSKLGEAHLTVDLERAIDEDEDQINDHVDELRLEICVSASNLPPLTSSRPQNPIAALFIQRNPPIDETLEEQAFHQPREFEYVDQSEWRHNESSPRFDQPMILPYLASDDLHATLVRVSVYDVENEQVRDEDRVGSLICTLAECVQLASMNQSINQTPRILEQPLEHEDPIKQVALETSNSQISIVTAFVRPDEEADVE